MVLKSVYLGEEYEEIPLTAIGDLAFTRFSWLLKSFNSMTEDSKERCYNLKLSSAWVGTENAYPMFNPLSANPTKWSNTLKQFVGKCRQIVWVCLTILWDLHLKAWNEASNLKEIIMGCVMLYNLSIVKSDPCKPCWRLTV